MTIEAVAEAMSASEGAVRRWTVMIRYRSQEGGSGCMQVVELGFGRMVDLGWTSDDDLQATSADYLRRATDY